jgi:thymidylate synthase
MDEYHQLVADVLRTGSYESNRTGVDTIAGFGQSYRIDLAEGFPLLTTKDLSGFRWNSLIHEILWYLKGEAHIRDLREHTKIWDAWSNEEGELDTAYGRFWRRYPVPAPSDALDGESWAGPDNQWVTTEARGARAPRRTFDQLQAVIDTLNGENANASPRSRRLVINAWHPANAWVSTLPPCHYSFVFNVQDGKLNCHLTQRSGDIALGIPFNIACYSILTQAIAQQTGYELGEFSHTVVDAHIYCGNGERGEWYDEHLDTLQAYLRSPDKNRDPFEQTLSYIDENAPEMPVDARGNPLDHVPNLLRQLQREPGDRPTLTIADKPLDALVFEDFELTDYTPADGLEFGVAE